MRDLMRRILWQATPLLVVFFTTAYIADHYAAREAIAKRVAPTYVVPSEDVLLARAKKRCAEEQWARALYIDTDCEYKHPEKRKQAIGDEAQRVREAYYHAHIVPRMDFIEEASYAVATVLALLLGIVLLYNLYRHVKENGMPSVLVRLGSLFNALRSRKAEHDFMRYKRLFENGLLTEEEFERKKRELKPKILQGQS